MGACQYSGCKSYIDASNFNTGTTANIIEQLNNDFIVIQEDYIHPIYGLVDILEFKEPKQFNFKLAHKLICFNDPDEYQMALKYYETKYYGFNHPNLLIIHALQHKKIDRFFDTLYKISLLQELNLRNKMYFEETEILFFLDSLIGSQAFLQSKGLIIEQLNFENVHLTNLLNGSVGLKILNPLLNNPYEGTFQQLFYKIMKAEEIDLNNYPLLSPEQSIMIRNQKLEQYNQFKSNVFILGLVLVFLFQMTLELCSLKQSYTLYRDYSIDITLLNETIKKIQDKYSDEIPLILSGMLQIDPKLRCDFLELDELLDASTLRGKRLKQIWTLDDYQYGLIEKKVHFSTKQHSLAHPEINSQLSNQSLFQKGSHMSIKQVLSKNSKESKASSSFIQRKESYSPQGQKKNLFKKFETEQASKGGSKKLIVQDGKGIETLDDGLTYEGEFVAGKKEGMGKLLNDDNELIYEGYFHDNQFHKSGILKNQNAVPLTDTFDYRDFDLLQNFWVRYDGDFNLGKKHGHGQLVLTNTERYTGQFNNDFIDGSGMFITRDGQQIIGHWIKNKLQQ